MLCLPVGALLVRLSDSDLLLPTETLPKLRLDGLIASCPAPAPVPVKGTVAGWLEPSMVIERLPVAFPDAFGANVMVKVEL